MKRAFDKSVKGYVYITDQNTKLSLPGELRKQELYLLQTNLLFQIKVLDKKSFSVDVVFSDTDKVKRRLNFYAATHFHYSKDNIARAVLNARVPCSMILEGVWLNL